MTGVARPARLAAQLPNGTGEVFWNEIGIFNYADAMKTNPANESDPPLDELLQEWKVCSSLPPRFQERVWHRIALRDASERPGWRWVAYVGRWLSQPGLAAGYVTALLVVGFVLGWTRGLERRAQVDADLRSRYLQVLNPYQNSIPGP